MLANFLWVALGGALGSSARYAISLAFSGSKLPFATFIVNFVGCLVIGLVIGSIGKSQSEFGAGHALAVVGLCGGFTTFSTFSFEVVNYLKTGQVGLAGLYVGASLALCFLATFIGVKITHNI